MHDDIFEHLNAFIREQFLTDQKDAHLSPATNLIESGIIDSLGIFILIDFIQQNFGVEVAPADVTVENFQSIEMIRNLIISRKNPLSK